MRNLLVLALAVVVGFVCAPLLVAGDPGTVSVPCAPGAASQSGDPCTVEIPITRTRIRWEPVVEQIPGTVNVAVPPSYETGVTVQSIPCQSGSPGAQTVCPECQPAAVSTQCLGAEGEQAARRQPLRRILDRLRFGRSL